MALYDAPVDTGYKILTHTSQRRFATNGWNQVGNTSVPANSISPYRVAPSAIYNKNLNQKSLSGLRAPGYGRVYPYNTLGYAGAGSPRTSVLKGLYYAGAGSPRGSVLADAYVNDNPPAGTLTGGPKSGLRYAGAGSPRTSVLKGLRYAGAGSPRGSVLRGLRDTTTDTTGALEGPTLPGTTVQPTDASQAANPGLLSSLENSLSSIFGTAVSSGTTAAQISVAGAITGASSPSAPAAPSSVLSTVTTPTFLGLSTTTLLLIGLGVYAYTRMK